MQLKNIAVLGVSAAIAAVGIGIGAGGSAYADSLLGSAGIKDDSVRSIDVKDGTLGLKDMRPGAVTNLQGQDGVDGLPVSRVSAASPARRASVARRLAGAFYATAFYNDGDTNEGAVASVACNADPAKTDYVAIAGGVQTLALDDTPLDNNTPVSSCVPRPHGLGNQQPKGRPSRRLDRAVRRQRRCHRGQGSGQGQGLGSVRSRRRHPDEADVHPELR